MSLELGGITLGMKTTHERIAKRLRRLADQGTTVLMVEQNVKSALACSDDAIALESGRLMLPARLAA